MNYIPESRPVRYSQTTITELMIPAYANFGGKIHGGVLLSLLDKVAYACASKHAGAYCVTVSVEGVDFLEPIEVGELLSLHASVNHVGRSSMVVGIKVIAEDVVKGYVRHTNTSYFTMVAKGEDNKPQQVPKLELETEEDVRRFIESIKRKQIKEDYKNKLSNEKSKLYAKAEIGVLQKERCVLKFNS